MAGDAIALSELARTAADPTVECPRVYFSALMAGPSHLKGDTRVDQISHGRPRGDAPWARAITPESDIVKAVSEAKATGATGIKIYTDLTPEIVTKITAEAHKQGLKVWSHAAIYPGRPSDAVGAGVDVIVDLVGGSYFPVSLEALSARGRVICIGTTAGARSEIDLGLVMRKRAAIIGTMLRARSIEEKADAIRRFAAAVLSLVSHGRIRPVIDRVYPADQVREAHERIESNASVGKIVLTFA